MKRLPDGKPCMGFQGNKVVAADAIARLSGVSTASVIKVMTAIEMMSKITGISTDALVHVPSIPLKPAVDHDYILNPARYNATEQVIEWLVDMATRDPAMAEHDGILNFRRRLGRRN